MSARHWTRRKSRLAPAQLQDEAKRRRHPRTPALSKE